MCVEGGRGGGGCRVDGNRIRYSNQDPFVAVGTYRHDETGWFRVMCVGNEGKGRRVVCRW